MPGGFCPSGWGQRVSSLVSELSHAAPAQNPNPSDRDFTIVSPFLLAELLSTGRFCDCFDEKSLVLILPPPPRPFVPPRINKSFPLSSENLPELSSHGISAV